MTSPSYARAALDGECAAIASTAHGRNEQLNKSAFSIGQLVGAGMIDRVEAEHQLYSSAEAAGYVGKDGPSAAKATIKSGLDKGQRQPRQPKENGYQPQAESRFFKPRPTLDEVPIPDWTPPNEEEKPKFCGRGQPEPPRYSDDARRHVYLREGQAVRVKVKKTDGGFVDWYRVKRPSDGAVGWQAKKPADYVPVPYVPVPYVPAGAPNPFDPERVGEILTWPEGEKDCDILARNGFLAFTFGGSSDVPDCEDLLQRHHVVIPIDNDEAGEKCAAKKVKVAMRTAASVRVVRFSDLPDGGDASDFFEAGGTAEDFLDRREEYQPNDQAGADDAKAKGNSEDPDFGTTSTGPSILFYGDKEPEPPPYIIQGVLPQKQVAIVAGQFGAGKTFVAHDISFSTMTALPFIDHEVERQGAVLWLGAEGANEVAIRLKAAAILRTGEAKLGELPFAYQAFDVPTLTAPDAHERLMKLVEEMKAGLATRFPGTELVLIVIDTLNSAAGFQDENSASETQRVFNVLRRLSDASGALVLVIDHFGKMTETGVRGSSAKSGAADAILAVLADKDETTGKVANRRLAVTKLRGAPTGRIVPFELKPVPVNEWGTTHCGIVWDAVTDPNAARQKEPKPAWSGASKVLKSCIERALIDHGSEQQPFGTAGPRVKAVPVEKVRTEFYQSYAAESQDAKRRQFNRLLPGAIEKNLIATRQIGASLQDWVWFSKVESDQPNGTPNGTRDSAF